MESNSQPTICSECKWCYKDTAWTNFWQCRHPTLMRSTVVDYVDGTEYYVNRKGEPTDPHPPCCSINKDGNCPHYEEGWTAWTDASLWYFIQAGIIWLLRKLS